MDEGLRAPLFLQHCGVSNCLNTPIDQIDNEEVRSLFNGLCRCLGLGPLEAAVTFKSLASVIACEGNQPALRALNKVSASEQPLLTTKVSELTPGSGVHDVCSELVRLSPMIKRQPNTLVLSIIKQSAKLRFSKSQPPPKLTRRQRNDEFKKDLIMRSRETTRIWAYNS